jgi:hypothetical protein
MAEQSAEGEKAESSADNPILKFLGPSIFEPIVAVITWFAVGPTSLRPELIRSSRSWAVSAL